MGKYEELVEEILLLRQEDYIEGKTKKKLIELAGELGKLILEKDKGVITYRSL